MFRYIVALLLVSLYSKSSGAPTSSTTDLSVLLTQLASTCENQFLRTQIANKVKDCHVLVPPYDEKKFQCMLFYDISTQLCTAVAASKLALAEDYTTEIQKEQDVMKLCTTAKDWHFSELGEVYKKYVSVVFNDSVRCARVCSADNDDILNVESNFYCKYYKWGTEILKTQVITAPTQSGSAVGEPANVPANSDLVTKKSASPQDSNAPSSVDANLKNPVLESSKPLAGAEIGVNQVAAADPNLANLEKVKPEAVNVETHPILSNAGQLTLPGAPTPDPAKPDTSGDNTGAIDSNTAPIKDGTHDKHNQVSQIEPDHVQETSSNVKNDIKPKVVETDAMHKKDEFANNLPNNQVDKPNQNDMVDPDEYQNELDSDELKGLSDNQGGDDGDDGSLGDLEPKADKNKIDNNKKSESAIMSQFNVNDISQKEYYPSDGFPEEDDHFFSFFLTAIIMVVLLYVLYHNKSKVSKVIMGLIVEGRQPGRRRNSRGHAYKRLDTLEQAMSASSAAPPSKIIY